MRLKRKKQGTNLTFRTIALRDAEIKDFFDGDVIKVLDASTDSDIKSGWAIYRFQESNKSFDLLEQEAKEDAGLKPDYITTTEGAAKGDRTVNTIVSPYNMRPMDESIEILEDFDFTMGVYNRGDGSYITASIAASEGFRCRYIPVNTKAGLKYLQIGTRVSCGVINGMENNFMHWTVNAKLVSERDSEAWANNPVNNYLDGKCIHHNSEEDGTNEARNIPFMIIRAELGNNGRWNTQKTSVFKLWKKYVKVPAIINDVPQATLDNRTLMKNANGKLVNFQDLSHGAGFEFPKAIHFRLEPSNDLRAFNLVWDGYRNGKDVFKYKNVAYKLGLRTFRCYSDTVKQKIETHGLIHYCRVSCYIGYSYWSQFVDFSADFPSLKPHAANLKQFLPIAIVKLVYNADYTLNTEETQVSHIYRNGLLAAEEAETPSLQEVTDKGYETTNRIVQRRNGENSYGHTIEDETGSAKHSQNILDYAGHYELAGKDKSIGISLNGEGVADFKKSVSTAALKVKTGAAKGKVAFCNDEFGNFIWDDMPEAKLPPIKHNYPDGLSCDYTVTNEDQHKFSVPDAIRGFRSDMRLLKDFDFNISFDYKTVKFDLIGGSTLNIPVMTKDGQHSMQISPLSLVMDSANRGKTIYIPVFKRVFSSVTGDAYYLGNTSQQNGVQVFNDGTTETTQLVMQIRIDVPTDWNNWKHSDVTVFKYWKKALGTFDELMDYRLANP
ncbi:hypothetical protein L3073_06000 [Ancylomarina sp. DW003]|nr:hypothetical protein [Ancylomarina sp. DW003]MDE5421753.1 hypothetical protein [Ancylomarina sp. DW003]